MRSEDQKKCGILGHFVTFGDLAKGIGLGGVTVEGAEDTEGKELCGILGHFVALGVESRK